MASKRSGHTGKSKFLQLKGKRMIDDTNHIDKIIPNDNLCEACINSKQARLLFEKAIDKISCLFMFVIESLLQLLIIKI